MLPYIVVADTTDDNQPLGVMFILTDNIDQVVKDVFEREAECDHVRYMQMLPGRNDVPADMGMMFDWEQMEVVYRAEEN